MISGTASNYSKDTFNCSSSKPIASNRDSINYGNPQGVINVNFRYTLSKMAVGFEIKKKHESAMYTKTGRN